MKRCWLSVIIIISLLTCCRTILPSDYKVDNDSSLVNLQPVADVENMMRKITYEDKQLDGDVLPVRLKNRYVSPEFNSTEKYSTDERINDLLRLFANELKSSNGVNDSVCKGVALLEVNYFAETRDPFFSFLSLLTAFIPNLLGMPYGNVMTDMEINLTLKDYKNNTVKSYSRKGNANTYIGLYWSYADDAKRKSAIEAFKAAMKEIKTNLVKDSDWLKSQLN